MGQGLKHQFLLKGDERKAMKKKQKCFVLLSNVFIDVHMGRFEVGNVGVNTVAPRGNKLKRQLTPWTFLH